MTWRCTAPTRAATPTARRRRTSASPPPPPTARPWPSTSPAAARSAGSTCCTAWRTRARATRCARCSPSSFYICNGDDAATLVAEGVTTAFINAVTAAFQDAAIQGITVCIASGDTGSNSKVNDGKAHVQYPGSDPWVLSVGGTPWATSPAPASTSTCGTTRAPPTPRTGAPRAAASAISSRCRPTRSRPGVPASVNPGHRVGRGVPDVAANASYNAGYSGIFHNGAPMIGNGTSASAAAVGGLRRQAQRRDGHAHRLHQPDPVLEGLDGVPRHRPRRGPGQQRQRRRRRLSGQRGLDACTGWGSIDGAKMLNMLRGVGMAPGLAVFENKLFMAWKGIEHDQRIWWSSFDGAQWAPQQSVAGVATSCGVSLAVFAGKLYMAWKGMNRRRRHLVLGLQRRGVGAAAERGGRRHQHRPVAGRLRRKLFMAWKGMVSDQRIWYSSFDGAHWAPQQVVPGVWTSVGPQLAVFQNSLYAIWKGMDSDQGLWYTHFNGAAWAPQKQVPGRGHQRGRGHRRVQQQAGGHLEGHERRPAAVDVELRRHLVGGAIDDRRHRQQRPAPRWPCSAASCT